MHKRSGFTLLELLVVMVILVILAGVVTVVVVKRIDEARRARATSDIHEFSLALEMYKHDNMDYPSTEQGLQSLCVKPQGEELPNWQVYIKHNVPQDPWGRDYIYKYPGERKANSDDDSYDLYTLGKDGKEGGTGPDADIYEDELK